MISKILLTLFLTFSYSLLAVMPFQKTSTLHKGDLEFKHFKAGVSRLEDFKGKLLIVHIWASWCGSCMVEMPSIKKFNKSIDRSKIKLLMVSTDFKNQSKMEKFIDDEDMNFFDIVLDPHLGQYFKSRAIPTTIFINGEGKELGRIVGGINWESKDIKEKINKMVSENEILMKNK